MQAYNTELRECLVHLNRASDAQVQTKMQQLALEALRLAGCRLLLNPAVHDALINGQMEHGHEAQQQLDQTFYMSLLVTHSATTALASSFACHIRLEGMSCMSAGTCSANAWPAYKAV